MDVEALFCFLNEVEQMKSAFYLEPNEMHLKSGESKVLRNNRKDKFIQYTHMFMFVLDTQNNG